MRMPMFLFAMRILIRNILVLAHNICVIVVVFLVFDIWPGTTGLLVIPALPLWIINGLAMALLLGGICARFRDILPIVNSVMQIAFFLSPVIWRPEQLGARAIWLPLNPFYDMLKMVRDPLLIKVPSLLACLGVLSYRSVFCVFAWSSCRPRTGR